jgi:Ca2+-binding RTX toxin-like protein
MAALIAPLILASTVLAAPGAAWAAVVVTDAPDFEAAIDAGESVVVSCNVGQVRVEVVGASATDYLTTCGAVTSLTVTASLAFDNSIDLPAVAAASFPALTSVLLAGGPSRHPDRQCAGRRIYLTSGGGNDTTLGGSGYDTLSFNGRARTKTCRWSRTAPASTSSATLHWSPSMSPRSKTPLFCSARG